jgi:hypothetical protein
LRVSVPGVERKHEYPNVYTNEIPELADQAASDGVRSA